MFGLILGVAIGWISHNLYSQYKAKKELKNNEKVV